MLKRSAKRGANMKKYIDMINTKKNIISPKTFLSLSDKEKRNIKSYDFIPPAIGDNNFGKFAITMKYSTYTAHYDRT